MDIYISDLIEGFEAELSKYANVFEMTGSIIPNIDAQTRWKFAKHEHGLQLSDGNNIHHFHFVEGEQEQDFPMEKKDDVQSNEFNSHGTAQIHKANPGLIYFTLQDGKKNPTYTFKHVSENQWRAVPKHHKEKIFLILQN